VTQSEASVLNTQKIQTSKKGIDQNV